MPCSESLSSRMPLPTDRATSGRRCGPSTRSATTRITIISSGRGAEMKAMLRRLLHTRRGCGPFAGVVHGGAVRRVERLDRCRSEPQLACHFLHDHAPGGPGRAVRAKPSGVPAVRVTAGLPLIGVEAADAGRVAGEAENAPRGAGGALLVVVRGTA